MVLVHDSLLLTLILGAYAFSAGCYIFSWKCYKELRDNHIGHLEARIKQLESK